MTEIKEKLVAAIGSTHYGTNLDTTVGKNFQRSFIEKIADNLLSNGVTLQGDVQDIGFGKWVPVSDKLPDHNKPVLVFCENVTIAGGRFIHIGSLESGKFWFLTTQPGFSSFPVREWQVTHWMPLPERPEKEEEEHERKWM